MVMALIFAGVLLLVAVFSIYWQLQNWQGLRRPNIPSDERRYRRNQVIMRITNGVLLLGLAGMIAGAFFSGMEQRADELGNKIRDRKEGEERPPIAPEDKEFLQDYWVYWASVLGLLFVVVTLAIIDLWATRRYAWAQMRRMQGEHRAILERDLAVYRQQKANSRMKTKE